MEKLPDKRGRKVIGSKKTMVYRFRKLILPIFLWNTKRIYRKIAKEVANQIGDYINSGFQVVGLIGIGGSPTCGISTTLDLKKFDLLAQMNLDTLNTQTFNEFLYRELLIEGKGLFIQALEQKLKEKKIQVTFYEHSLVSERDNIPSSFTF